MQFLAPLSGADLICVCKLGKFCHGHVLIKTCSDNCLDEFAVDAACEKMDAMSVSCVMEGMDDDDELDLVKAAAGEEVTPAPKFVKNIEAVNETIRSEATNIREERPHWFPSWIKLIAIIRAFFCSPVFCEMFAGKSRLDPGISATRMSLRSPS